MEDDDPIQRMIDEARTRMDAWRTVSDACEPFIQSALVGPSAVDIFVTTDAVFDVIRKNAEIAIGRPCAGQTSVLGIPVEPHATIDAARHRQIELVFAGRNAVLIAGGD